MENLNCHIKMIFFSSVDATMLPSTNKTQKYYKPPVMAIQNFCSSDLSVYSLGKTKRHLMIHRNELWPFEISYQNSEVKTLIINCHTCYYAQVRLLNWLRKLLRVMQYPFLQEVCVRNVCPMLRSIIWTKIALFIVSNNFPTVHTSKEKK